MLQKRHRSPSHFNSSSQHQAVNAAHRLLFTLFPLQFTTDWAHFASLLTKRVSYRYTPCSLVREPHLVRMKTSLSLPQSLPTLMFHTFISSFTYDVSYRTFSSVCAEFVFSAIREDTSLGPILPQITSTHPPGKPFCTTRAIWPWITHYSLSLVFGPVAKRHLVHHPLLHCTAKHSNRSHLLTQC